MLEKLQHFSLNTSTDIFIKGTINKVTIIKGTIIKGTIIKGTISSGRQAQI